MGLGVWEKIIKASLACNRSSLDARSFSRPNPSTCLRPAYDLEQTTPLGTQLRILEKPEAGVANLITLPETSVACNG